MSDPIITNSETETSLDQRKLQPQGVRYSLKEMLGEVVAERKESAQGRELLDANEIGKMFAYKRHRKRTKK
jgi:hypothetical protein